MTLVMCFTMNSIAQIDTIFKISGDTIAGVKISKITSMNLWYTENGIGKSISIKEIQSHTFVNEIKSDVSKKESFIMNKDVNGQDELIFLRHCLGKFYKEWKTGVILCFSGIGLTIIGFPVAIATTSNIPLIIGGVTSLVGGIIILDSHKWLKRASIGVGGSGFTIQYKF